jgi:hypothetical protein
MIFHQVKLNAGKEKWKYTLRNTIPSARFFFLMLYAWLTRYQEYRTEYITTQKRAYFELHKNEEWYVLMGLYLDANCTFQ